MKFRLFWKEIICETEIFFGKNKTDLNLWNMSENFVNIAEIRGKHVKKNTSRICHC